jgi:hypothetical protein
MASMEERIPRIEAGKRSRAPCRDCQRSTENAALAHRRRRRTASAVGLTPPRPQGSIIAPSRSAGPGMARTVFYEPSEAKAGARAAVLRAYDRAEREVSRLGGRINSAEFVRRYNSGAIKVSAWVREGLPTISVASLMRWRQRKAKAGDGGLLGRYGHNAGKGLLETSADLRQAIAKILAKTPDASAREILEGLHARDLGRDLAKRTLERYLAGIR